MKVVFSKKNPKKHEDLYCLSWICLNSLVFTIRRQLVNRKPEPTPLPIQGIFKPATSHRQGMRATGLWWRRKLYTAMESKLAEVMAWGIEPPTFRLGVWLWKKSDTLTTLPQRTIMVRLSEFLKKRGCSPTGLVSTARGLWKILGSQVCYSTLQALPFH